MNSELIKLIEKIQQNTGVIVNVNQDKDAKEGNTLFTFNFEGEKYTGTLADYPNQKNFIYMFKTLCENFAAGESNLSRDEYLKNILLGDCNTAQIQKFSTKFNIPEMPCYAIVLSAESRLKEIITLLEQYDSNIYDTILKMDDTSCVYVKFIDTEEQSSAEFATFLVQSLFEEIGAHVKIGIGGTVNNLSDLEISYQQAANAVRMSKMLNTKGNIHSYKEFLLVKMLEDIPSHKLEEYMKLLLGAEAKEIFENEDMINTAEEFLENSLNVSETSRNLYMHRNTLMYRLDKIEKITGLDIRNFKDAITFRVITILYRLTKQI